LIRRVAPLAASRINQADSPMFPLRTIATFSIGESGVLRAHHTYLNVSTDTIV